MSFTLKHKKYVRFQELLDFLLKSATYALGTADLRERVLLNNKSSTETNGIFIFFEGYLLALLHQLFLNHLSTLSPKLVFDIGAIILRCFIFIPNIFSGQSLVAPILIQIPFDLAILYSHYRKEVDDRKQFLQIYKQKEDGKRFKSLIMNSLPESMIVVDSEVKGELFVNEAYKKVFRNPYETKKSGKTGFAHELQRIQILKDSITPTSNLPEEMEKYLASGSDISFFDFLRKGTEFKIFEEAPFILQGHWSLPESKRSPLGRRVFDIKILGLNWEELSFGIMISDITHRESIIALKAADKNKDKVLASISHELKTPLNSIIAMVSLIKEKSISRISEYVNMCETSSNLLLHYINSIIDLQELKKSKFKLCVKKIEVKSFFDEVKNLFKIQCEKQRLTLNCEIDELLPRHIFTDKERLIQIFVHLMSNAVKFTRRGSITMKAVRVPKKNLILFSVEDTGKGMNKAEVERLFSPYGRLNSSSVSIRGAGLGLTLSNGLAKVLKGVNNDNKVINVESIEEKGSKFSFSLPFNLNDEIKADRAQQHYYRQDIPERPIEEELDEINIIYHATSEGHPTENDFRMRDFIDSRPPEDIVAEEDDDNKELEELRETMGEYFVDSNLQAFLSQHGLTVKEKIVRYKTKTKDNFSLMMESMKSMRTFSNIEFKKTTVHDSSPKSSGLRLNGGSPLKDSLYHSSSSRFLPVPIKSLENSPFPLQLFKKIRTDPLTDGNFFKIESASSSTSDFKRNRNREYSEGSETCRDLMLATENDLMSPRRDLPTPRETNQAPSFGTLKAFENSRRVLVVDDNTFNLMVVKNLLKDEGYKIETAIDGQDALDKFEEAMKEKQSFDLILMDLQMPIMDGFEASRRLIQMMKMRGVKETPIIPLTANCDAESAERCKKIGMRGFITKPLTKERILKDINRIVFAGTDVKFENLRTGTEVIIDVETGEGELEKIVETLEKAY